MEQFASAKLSADEYRLAVKVGLSAVQECRAVVKVIDEQRKADEAYARHELEASDAGE